MQTSVPKPLTPSFVISGSINKRLRGVGGALLIDFSTASSARQLQFLWEEPVWSKDGEVKNSDSVLPQPIITQVLHLSLQ
jgi:hypothetical protein